MIELLLIACLGTGDCREVPLLYDARDMSMIACMVNGQRAVARWHERNPNWSIERWSCGHLENRADAA